MDDSYDVQIENIFDRFANGSMFNEHEASQIIGDIDDKLKELDGRMISIEDEMSKEIDKLKLNKEDENRCQLNSFALHCFLNNVVQTIERNSGLEDVIFRDLIQFCHQNSIVLPSSKFTNMEDYHSVTSVNTCSDENEEETLRLWNKIKTKLKNAMINIIRKLEPTDLVFEQQLSKGTFDISYEKEKLVESAGECIKYLHHCRLDYMEMFCCLFTFDQAFHIYCTIRENEIENRFSILKKDNINDLLCSTNDFSIFDSVHEIIKSICMMIKDDTVLLEKLSSFKSQHLSILANIYTKDLTNFMQMFLASYSITSNETHKNNFAVHDVNKFAKIFNTVKLITTTFSIFEKSISHNNVETSSPSQSLDVTNNSSNFIFDAIHESSTEIVYHFFDGFETLFKVLCKIIPSYLLCVFDVLENKKESTDLGIESMMHVSDDLLFQSTCLYPYKVSYKCATIVTVISDIICYLSFTKSYELNEIRETTAIALIDSFNVYINNIEESLSNVYTIPGLNITTLYEVVADVLFLKNQVAFWDDIGDEDRAHAKKRSNFAIIQKRFEDIIQQLTDKVKDYHIYILKSSIVYDLHSNNWQDEKAFMEGERCSFTVQMYNFYMEGVIYDNKQMFPLPVCKSILRSISEEMLVFFVSRYILVKPSYRRVKQLKADVFNLLLNQKLVLSHIVDETSEYLADANQDKYSFSHDLCTGLMEAMIIVCSPLQTIWKVLSNYTSNKRTDTTQWLELIASIDNLSMTNEKLLFNILTTQCVADGPMILKLLSSKNIISLLVKNIDQLQEESITVKDAGLSKLNKMFIKTKQKKILAINQKKFLQYLFRVLLKTSEQSFIAFIALFIESDNSKSFKVQKSNQFPIWLELIANHLYAFFKRILSEAVDLLIHEERCKKSPSSNFTKIQTLPCGCTATPLKDNKKFRSVSSLLHNCLMRTLALLAENIYVIPDVFWIILAYVKSQPGYNASWIQQPNLGTKILASLLFAWLSERENFSYLSFHTEISDDTFENIKDFAELLWHVIYNLTHDVTDDPKISMDIFKDLQGSSSEIQSTLKLLCSWCNRTEYKSSKSTTAETDYSSDYDDNFAISPSQTDVDTLKYIFSIIKVNQKLIKNLLYCKTDTLNGNKLQGACNDTYNPIMTFDQIGDFPLNHAELIEKELDWDLLASRVVFGKFRTLIWNRFEFQDNADNILTDEEKYLVSKIKESLHLDVHE